jgi:hypothetical protein
MNRLIVLMIILLASVCLVFWVNFNGSLSDFGLNGFTEALGILVTVLFIDQIIKRQEELRSLPQRATAYEDVRFLTSRIISFWCDVLKSCVADPSPDNYSELFNKENFEKILQNLNLDSQPNVIPKRTWFDWFPENLADHKKRAETILERHNYVLDPNAYLNVHKIATDGIDPQMIKSLLDIDRRSGFPRVHILASYWLLPEDYCNIMLELIVWCENQYKILERRGIRNLKKVSGIPKWNAQPNPPCLISATELERQIAAMKEFQESGEKINF